MVLDKLNLIKGIIDLCRNIYTIIPHHDISSRQNSIIVLIFLAFLLLSKDE